MNFLGGWFDIEPGNHREIEGLGKLVLFPFEFVTEMVNDTIEDIRELAKKPEERLESLERRYREEGEREAQVEKEKSKLQEFILANKEAVKERLIQFREDFREGKDLFKEIAFEAVVNIVESDTLEKKIRERKQQKEFNKPGLFEKEARMVKENEIIRLPGEVAQIERPSPELVRPQNAPTQQKAPQYPELSR